MHSSVIKTGNTDVLFEEENNVEMNEDLLASPLSMNKQFN